jgi:hypothetical protein
VASGRRSPRYLLSGRQVQGHFPSRHCVSRYIPSKRRVSRYMPFYQTRSVRAFAFVALPIYLVPENAGQFTCCSQLDAATCMRTTRRWAPYQPFAQRVSKRRPIRTMNGKVYGDRPDEVYHGIWHPDDECLGICRPDTTYQGILLPDVECQGICLRGTTNT